VEKEEQEFNESMMKIMDNMNSVLDFFPALDFLVRKQRAIAYEHSVLIKKFILKVFFYFFSLFFSPLPPSALPLLVKNIYLFIFLRLLSRANKTTGLSIQREIL
jgi:hypothetical protein